MRIVGSLSEGGWAHAKSEPSTSYRSRIIRSVTSAFGRVCQHLVGFEVEVRVPHPSDSQQGWGLWLFQ